LLASLAMSVAIRQVDRARRLPNRSP
jgi:hypothetical protein